MEHYLTQGKLDELKKELENYKTTRRLEVAKRLKRAKELGDLSENSEYFEAREEQQLVESRIYELEETVKNASIIKMTHGSKTINLGTTFRAKKGENEIKFILVGPDEVNPDKGMISHQSPLGKEFLGKKIGDSVQVTTPAGKAIYKITAIE
jgi:transcription elongation factor GreA